MRSVLSNIYSRTLVIVYILSNANDYKTDDEVIK